LFIFFYHLYFLRTALHWACKKGYLDVAALLLKNGADRNLRSEMGEIPASLCSNQQILYLLGINGDVQRIMNDSSHNVSAYTQSDFLHASSNNPSKTRSTIYDDSRSVTLFQDG